MRKARHSENSLVDVLSSHTLFFSHNGSCHSPQSLQCRGMFKMNIMTGVSSNVRCFPKQPSSHLTIGLARCWRRVWRKFTMQCTHWSLLRDGMGWTEILSEGWRKGTWRARDPQLLQLSSVSTVWHQLPHWCASAHLHRYTLSSPLISPCLMTLPSEWRADGPCIRVASIHRCSRATSTRGTFAHRGELPPCM